MEFHEEPGELCFYNILKRAGLTLDEPVTILTSYDPGDKTPCVTMLSTPAGEETDYPYYKKTPLPEDHPYYDSDNPDEQYITEYVLRTRVPGAISLNAWADTKGEKSSLVYQIRQAIKRARMNDYSQCSNLIDGNCKTTDETCDAISNLGHVCPYHNIIDKGDSNYRGPSNAINDYGIYDLIIQNPQSLDELGVIPEVYHSSILITFYYYDEYVRETAPVCGVGDEESSFIDYNSENPPPE